MSRAHGPSPIATLRSACLGVFFFFFHSAASEGPFTTFTTLLAPFQGWCFPSFILLASVICVANGGSHDSTWQVKTLHANKCVFFSLPCCIARGPAVSPDIGRRQSLLFLDTRLEFFLCVCVCIFFSSSKDIFTQSCCDPYRTAACLAHTRLHFLGSPTVTYADWGMCLRTCSKDIEVFIYLFNYLLFYSLIYQHKSCSKDIRVGL